MKVQDRLKQLREDLGALEEAQKPAVKKLKAGMAEYAAQWMAATNLGHTGKSPGSLDDLRRVIRAVEMDHSMDAPDAVRDETKDWLKLLKKNDKFTLDKILKDMPWMFESKTTEKLKLRGWDVTVETMTTPGSDPSEYVEISLRKGSTRLEVEEFQGQVKVLGPKGPWKFDLTSKKGREQTDQLLGSFGAPTYSEIMDAFGAAMGQRGDEPSMYGGE